MSRRSLIILSAVNSLLVLFIFGLIFLNRPHQQTPQPQMTTPLKDLNQENVETLQTAFANATTTKERILLLQTMPPSSQLVDFYQALIRRAIDSPSSQEAIELQNLAFDRWVKSVADPSEILEQTNTIILEPAQSIAQKDFALRASITRLDQLISLGHPANPEQLRQLLDIALQKNQANLQGTALLAGAYLHSRHPELVGSKYLEDQIEVLIDTPNLPEYNQACALQVIAELRLTDMLPYVRDQIRHPGSDAIKLKAIQALGAIGTNEDLPLLNEQEASTPELFWATIHAQEQIKERLTPPHSIATH
ncbi:MAG: hypothetical protein Q7Q73_00465 [Verrucomicrobiota bacterium JB024]|nr:hypothetical protein [Verrucomicrobiota bacterium JB024]